MWMNLELLEDGLHAAQLPSEDNSTARPCHTQGDQGSESLCFWPKVTQAGRGKMGLGLSQGPGARWGAANGLLCHSGPPRRPKPQTSMVLCHSRLLAGLPP